MTTRRRGVGLPAVSLAFVLVLGLAQTALADPRDFTFENDSLSSITHVYVSPTSSDSWGDDVLGLDVLGPGQSVDITFDPNVGRTCIYDILVVTEDGTNTRKNRENLCTTTTENYSED